MNLTLKSKIGLILASLTTILFLIFNSSPKLAIKTYIFFLGHPVIAASTDIKTVTDQPAHLKENGTLYQVTDPPFESATQTELQTFIVYKYGFIHLAKYHGELW